MTRGAETYNPARDAKGRFVRTRPPEYVISVDEHGHLESVHFPATGWRVEAERCIPALLWWVLGFVCGWALAALLFAQVRG